MPLKKVGGGEAELGDEHHSVHVGPRDVVLLDSQLFRAPKHEVADVDAIPVMPPESMRSRVKFPVRICVNAPTPMSRNGTTNDGEIIHAARRTP